MNKRGGFLKLPFRFKVAERLNRMQYLKIQMIVLPPIIVVYTIMILASKGQVYFHVNFDDGLTRAICFLIYGLLVIAGLISFCASIARLHDCNRSGWWVLLINILGSTIIPVVLLYVWPGTKGENKYGVPPGEPSVEIEKGN